MGEEEGERDWGRRGIGGKGMGEERIGEKGWAGEGIRKEKRVGGEWDTNKIKMGRSNRERN